MPKFTRREFGRLSLSSLLAACAPRLIREPAKPIELPLGDNRKIKVLFHFGSHGSADHARAVAPVLRDFKPHVVCLEDAFQSEEGARKIEGAFYQLPRERLSDFHAGIRDLLEKDKPRVFILERFALKESRMGRVIRSDVESFRTKAVAAFLGGDSQQALYYYRGYWDIITHLNKKREKQIKDNLSKLHGLLTNRFPELAREREIRVVVNYGSVHTSIFKHALGVGFSEARRRMLKPAYFTPSHSYFRRGLFGLPVNSSDEEIARVFLGDLIVDHFAGSGANPSNVSAFANILSRKFTLDQFRMVSQHLAQVKPKARGEVEKATHNAFALAGINLPTNKEEIHAFLEKRRIPLARD